MLSPLNTDQSTTNHIVHNLLNVCKNHTKVLIMQSLRDLDLMVPKKFNACRNHTMFKLQKTRTKTTQFAVYISDTPVILKGSQGHQTYNNIVDPKQGYNQV